MNHRIKIIKTLLIITSTLSIPNFASAGDLAYLATSCNTAIMQLKAIDIVPDEFNCKEIPEKHIYWRTTNLPQNKIDRVNEICDIGTRTRFNYASSNTVACYYTT